MRAKLTESHRRLIKTDYNFDQKMMASFEQAWSQLGGRFTIHELLLKFRKLAYDTQAL